MTEIRTRFDGSGFTAVAGGGLNAIAAATARRHRSAREAVVELAVRLVGPNYRLQYVRPGFWRVHESRPIKAGWKPALQTTGSAHASTPSLLALAALVTIPLLVWTIGYCATWWPHRHLLSPKSQHQPIGGPLSDSTEEIAVSNHSPRAGALPRRAIFDKEVTCTNQ